MFGGKALHDFVTALQFLTRIHLVAQEAVAPEQFGRSVKFFPLVGAVIGAVLAGFTLLSGGHLPIHVLAVTLLVLEIALTGALHYDGLMDTADGIFSGRLPQRMLEIMKDSRVGANGVMACGVLLLGKWSLLLDLLPHVSAGLLFIMPVLGRLAMVIAITAFPYARPEGMGKAFQQYAGRPTLYFAAMTALVLTAPFGAAALIALAGTAGFALAAGRYISRRLGGLTGDAYGAITELAELVVLATFLLEREWSLLWI
jgi:adenosylcobinamide-GDP ribazoletransferase